MRTERLYSGITPGSTLKPGPSVRIRRTHTPALVGAEGIVLRPRGFGQVSVRTESGLTLTTGITDLEVIPEDLSQQHLVLRKSPNEVIPFDLAAHEFQSTPGTGELQTDCTTTKERKNTL